MAITTIRSALAYAVLVPIVLATAAPQRPTRGGTGPVAQSPELFGEGVFTTPAWDFFMAFTPDGRTAYFNRANGSFSHFTILVSRQRGATWSAPEVAPFSGRWSDADPHLTPDGSKLFFISNRPVAEGTEGAATPKRDYDIWYVERRGDGWAAPRHIGPRVSGDNTEWSPSVAANGNLYFGTVRQGGRGFNDIYVSRLIDGGYGEPENLGDSVNTAAGEVEPWVAPDESYLIFSGQGRPDGLGGFDLYISYRRNGTWSKAQHLGNGINSPSGDFNQSVSPDGRYLYFSSTRSVFDSVPAKPLAYAELQRRLLSPRNGLGDIYRIPMTAVLEGSR